MFTAHRIVPALLAAAVLTATSACASGGYYRYPTGSQTIDDRAYRRGYDEGREEGQNDARRGRAFDVRRHDEFRDARQQAYRQGFVDGYDDGYRRNARGPVYGSTRPNGRYDDRNGNYGSYRPYGSYGGYASPAAENGFRDGYDQGRDDARDRKPFDPVRATRYRSGDHDYNSRYGSRDDYKREYRAAFQQGYDRGYREVRPR
jgi:flagellar biosynthesis/type III secretory pathway protein FliH